jgi:hypothetical protein
MGFENEGQILTASDSVALTPGVRPKTSPFEPHFDAKMMPNLERRSALRLEGEGFVYPQ